MLGRSHAASGWCAGLAVAPIVGLHTLPEVALFAVATAGWALGPDLDHPGASASRLLGPFSQGASWLLRRASATIYRHTKGPRDENVTGTHRHASHTLVAAVLLGLLTTAAAAMWGPWAVGVVLILGVLLAETALGDWVLPVTAVAAGAIAMTTSIPAVLADVGGWIGIAVALGCFTHCLGDSATLSGCPWLWPIPIAGETWYEIRPPRWMRFRTGGTVETACLFPAFTVLGVLLIPGVWPLTLTIAHALYNQLPA